MGIPDPVEVIYLQCLLDEAKSRLNSVQQWVADGNRGVLPSLNLNLEEAGGAVRALTLAVALVRWAFTTDPQQARADADWFHAKARTLNDIADELAQDQRGFYRTAIPEYRAKAERYLRAAAALEHYANHEAQAKVEP